MDDVEIVRRVKNGDTEAFAVLVEKYHRHLLNFIFRILGEDEMVEDIGQEVFLSVYKSLGSFDERRETPFSAWLFIAARNRCISEIRRRRGIVTVRIEETDDIRAREKSAETMLIENERMVALRNSLEQLDEPHKAMIMRSLRGDSIAVIAREKGVSTGTVKSRLFRAKEKMRSLVREYLGGERRERV